MQPAIAVLELSSIAAGIRAGDAMVKRSPIEVLHAGTVHPGKYLVLVAGEVAHVEEALPAGREVAAAVLLDEIFLPDVDPKVVAALRGARPGAAGDALGIIETATVAAVLGAADRGVKGADVEILELRVADDLGGKAYCLFDGPVEEVEAAVELAVAGLESRCLVAQAVIPRLDDEMRANLAADAAFLPRLRG